MFYRTAILLPILLLATLCSYGYHTPYTIVNYNTDNGLPQNSITGIQFDRKGYCWLGTQMGLVRFDGQKFTVFGSDNIKGLRADRIFNVTCDTAGNIFASTDGIVSVLRINDSSSQEVSKPILTILSGDNIPSMGFVMPQSVANVIKAGPGSITLSTAHRELYLMQSTGSYYITPYITIPLPIKGSFPSYCLTLADESLLLLQPHNKVSVWTKGIQQSAVALRGPLWDNPDFQKGNFAAPYCVEGGYIYSRKTLYRLHLAAGVLYSEAVLEDIDIPSMSCLYFNKQHNKWYIGSAVSGLFIITPSDFYTPPVPDFAIGKGFHNQSVTDEGILSQQTLFRWDGTYKEYPLTPQLKSTWYNPQNKSVYYAPGLNLLRTNLSTGKTWHILDLATVLSSIYPDPSDKETLIFSTSFSIGKMRHDTLLSEQTIPGLTKGQELFASYPAGSDVYLLATWSGVKWYDMQRNKVYRSVLDSLAVRQLYPETPQRIWIASYGKGWYLYDKGKICRMPDGPSAALKTVNAVIDDGRGCFWLSSNNGLYKVSKHALLDYAAGKSEEVYFYAFTTKDHLPTNEFNACYPSPVWLQDSMLSLPSIKGLVWFYPHKVQLLLPNEGIYIEHIYVDHTELPHTDSTLTLDPDHGRIGLTVSSPYFGNKENMQLLFTIKGLENDWHQVPPGGDITIERLPAGTFSLIVRKASGMENGEYRQLVLPIQVHPFWYNTRLFYLAMLVLAAVVIYWTIRLRTRLLQVRNRKLKVQVALQTRDLNRMVRRLTQSEEALKQSNQTKDNIITTVLHDLRSPIRFLHTISKWVADDHTKMKPETLDGHLKELNNSTASLNSFTDQFFTWALSQHDAFSASYSWVDLQQLFNEKEILYRDIVHANGNRLVIVPTDIRCYTDLQLLSTVIRNLLDNANKYTTNGTLAIAASLTEDKTIITISDTGKGFDVESLKTFLDKEKTDRRKGNGSFIILELLHLIDGHLEAVSEPGKGTTFRIMIPRRNEAPDNKQAG
ncbi:ATP-binding protein [Chitinophagaceae bacterium MMS25-I14]